MKQQDDTTLKEINKKLKLGPLSISFIRVQIKQKKTFKTN